MIMLMSGRRRRDFRKRDVVCVPNPELDREQTKKFQIRSASDGKSQTEQRLDQRAEELLWGRWILAVQGEEFAKDLRQERRIGSARLLDYRHIAVVRPGKGLSRTHLTATSIFVGAI